jgi:uncharacterized phage infection (PIP) family protein YhgE
MRTPFAVSLMLSIFLLGAYWYTSVEAVCRLPIYYTIGEVDERFDLSKDEIRMALSEAESIWEEATGRNLFTYDEGSSIKVNFIYDERQRAAEEAEELKEKLDAKENVNDALGETYAELVKQYQNKQLDYQNAKETYERKLNKYNAEVNKYNEQGGAPSEVFAKLEKDRQALDKELVAINATAKKLNDLSAKINEVGDRGNELIEQYNDSVVRFNDSYGSSEEFTQGDYQGDEINIYTFKDKQELALVLAHEFGHSMSLDHVDNEKSIMYYLMGNQPKTLEPTTEDLAAFATVCGDVTTYQKLRERLIAILKSYGVL